MKDKVTLLVLLVLVFWVAPSASAQEQVTSICVVELEPVPFNEQGLPIGLSRILNENCFSTPAEAMTFITDGAVALPLTATQAEVNAAYEKYVASSLKPLQYYILVQFYDNTNYNNFMYQFVSSLPCPYQGGYAGMFRDTPYNDRAESGSAYSGCNKLAVFEHADTTGASLECFPGCSTFGVLNNEVSSWYVIYQ